jgi:hypothetical protein
MGDAKAGDQGEEEHRPLRGALERRATDRRHALPPEGRAPIGIAEPSTRVISDRAARTLLTAR